MSSSKNIRTTFGTRKNQQAWERLEHAAAVIGATSKDQHHFFMPKIAAVATAITLGIGCLGVQPAYASQHSIQAPSSDDMLMQMMSDPYLYLSDLGYQTSSNKITTSVNTVPISSVEGYTLTDFVSNKSMPPTKELYEKAATAGYETVCGSVTQPLVQQPVSDVIEKAAIEKKEEAINCEKELLEITTGIKTDNPIVEMLTSSENTIELPEASTEEKTDNQAEIVVEEPTAGEVLQVVKKTFQDDEDENDVETTEAKKVVSEATMEEDTEFSRKMAVGKADNDRKAEIKVNEEERIAKEEKQQAAKAEEQLNELILEAAKSQLGTPYVWGGTTPYEGLDCSGFTQYCYSTIGIDTSRTSETQLANALEVVPVEEAELGDILYTSGHVGIYAGGDEYIHAPTSGDVVRYATGINSFSYALRFTGTVS